MAVFRVHSFDARGVTSIVDDPMVVTHALLLADAYQVLRLLGTHPAIDPARIGVTGWSLGGSAALYAAWEPTAAALAPGGERFAAHLRPTLPRWAGTPIRVLHGAQDGYTPITFVEELAEEPRGLGVPIEVIAYPGARHSFDSTAPLLDIMSLPGRKVRTHPAKRLGFIACGASIGASGSWTAFHSRRLRRSLFSFR